MPYLLVTEDGDFMKFYLLPVAEIYQIIHGGQIIHIDEKNIHHVQMLSSLINTTQYHWH
jgi:hypothetical protein